MFVVQFIRMDNCHLFISMQFLTPLYVQLHLLHYVPLWNLNLPKQDQEKLYFNLLFVPSMKQPTHKASLMFLCFKNVM